ncbi:hypothetical protein B1R32_1018 [Abditibacterium utsteinense]|uniref:Uncharacterized protein n=1 Tax=Abditibacterium utsteinense TaxID=1960156 RepID=A0A2S8SWV0_9BACT|nr:hypothetical protein [Abditibacterium utsteinense]PQV65271.1 hypothetical protein B1R32_1018 [Abditibacterium utsteinense]
MADINDVQLGWYPNDPRNKQLCDFYIWSSHSLGKAKPSVELLERVREAFLMTTSPRRFIFRATYGHGKTHLALALANFFGRPHDSDQVQGILSQLRESSPAKAEGFAAFKAERPPYLVVRLFGENVSNLPQAVVSAVETALKENEATQDYKLDFWFDKALEGFDKFGEDQIARSNEFLAPRNTDFPTLCQGLRDRNGDLFELSCGLIEHIMGFAPDFGRAVELKALIFKVAFDLCGEGKPFSGLLILFDEFSAFTRSYARDYILTRGTPLQSLLDGVVNAGNLAVFVAFSQYDPNSDVQAIFQQIGATEDDRQNIDKELNRLPPSERFQLYSSLELVLSNFLLQDTANWDALTQDVEVWEQIEEATDDVMRLYGDHYSEAMGWGDERVQTLLSQGCFPFHPLTIAILCKSNLRGDESGARTVMQYLTGAFREQAKMPALQNGVLNWISPISLVEEFGRAIVDEDFLWSQYAQTLTRIGGEAPASQRATLHAMLLHDVVGLKVSRAPGSYERNIAVLSGQTPHEAQSALQELHAAGYLKRDETRNVYAFWPVGEDGSKVEKPLNQEVTATLNNPVKLVEALEKAVNAHGWPDEEVSGAPGHPQDWGAEMWILPRALFSAARLKKLAQTYSVEKLALNEPYRGFVVSLVATTNEELAYFKMNAQSVLDEALAGMDNPPPLILRVPQFAQGNFVKALVREQVLRGWDAEKKREVGIKPFEEFVASTLKEIADNRNGYISSAYIVPLPYRAVVEAKSIGGQLLSLSNLLKICYDQAYRFAPPFFTQDKVTTAALKSATRTACNFFLKGTFAGWQSDSGVLGAGKTRAIFDQFLVNSGASGWGIVELNNRICEPKSAKVREGWSVLEAAIPPGVEDAEVKPVILKLLNAPYGYDVNTASLLLCAWVGFNQSQLEFNTFSGRSANLRECLGQDLKKFLEEVISTKDLRITRRDEVETKKQVEVLIQKIRFKEPFSVNEATSAVAQLEIFAADESGEMRLINASQSAMAQLQSDLKLAEDYSQSVASLQKKTSDAASISDALKALSEAQKEIPVGCVRPETLISTADLTSQASLKLTQVTENFCARREALSDIRDVSKYQGELDTAKKWFVERGLLELRDRVQNALYALSDREEELQSEGKDAEFVASLKPFKSEKSLAVLRANLSALAAYQSNSPKTEAAIADARTAMEATLNGHLGWFSPLATQLDGAVSHSEFNRLDREISRYLDRFDGTPEGEDLSAFQKRIEMLGRVWEKVSELRRERPRNNADLKKLGQAFEKLSENEALSDAQKAHVLSVKAEIDTRFVAQVEAAKSELEAYETRNASGEDAVVLKNQLEDALKREMAYLSDEHKPKLRALDRALQRRIDDDEIKRVEANFLKIQDTSKRRECLRLLQKHAGLNIEEIKAESGVAVADSAAANGAIANGFEEHL